MSKSTVPSSEDTAIAIILDDDGAMHEVTYVYDDLSANRFELIEREAKERGIRYVDTIMFQLTEREVKAQKEQV